MFSLTSPSSERPSQRFTRLALGGVMSVAGVSHLTFARSDFQAQVPDWFPLDADLTVLGSGVAEIGFGLALLGLPRKRRITGIALAAFFIVIFPGNIANTSRAPPRSASTRTPNACSACSVSPR